MRNKCVFFFLKKNNVTARLNTLWYNNKLLCHIIMVDKLQLTTFLKKIFLDIRQHKKYNKHD